MQPIFLLQHPSPQPPSATLDSFHSNHEAYFKIQRQRQKSTKLTTFNLGQPRKVPQTSTAGINRSNTAARAVLEQPCSTGGRTDTVRPKQEPTGRTDLSDRSRLVLCNRSQELIGQACPTRRQVLRSDSACPTTGRTRLFEHRLNCRVRPLECNTIPLPFVFPDNDDLSRNPEGSTNIPDVLANNVPVDSNNNNGRDAGDCDVESDVHMEVKDHATEVIGCGGPPSDDNWAYNEDEMDQIKLKDRPGLPKGRKQKMLAAHLAKKCHDMDLEDLRKQVRMHGHYACLISKDKVALDAAFYKYQRQINIIAFQHLLKTNSVEEYLGQASRSQTTTI
ncbi:hypothetical protein PCASD_22617 [Puccinia coronata f. sp. avenae]|uniref:Uncharacterized protein n=1 Tax=Puccinia coronata f. sp. avenae TaxID=200324 RepID=A0A2N5S9F1_9BASI|nr:hypothetical protein PCASD_22617 [Puccinia coronata f. sp. avenae]